MHETAGGEERGTFVLDDFADELAIARENRMIGTSLWFENDRVRVFELRLEPGERGPFHVHDAPYFWTVVESGRGLQRFGMGPPSRATMRSGRRCTSCSLVRTRSCTTWRTSGRRGSASSRSS